MTDIDILKRKAWKTAEDKGFHDSDRSRAQALALIHSEVSEALEADREQDDEQYAEELADIIIRVLDHAEEQDIDIQKAIKHKMWLNDEREHKHGKEY